MHLKNIGSARLEATIQRFKELGVENDCAATLYRSSGCLGDEKALQENYYSVCEDHFGFGNVNLYLTFSKTRCIIIKMCICT